MNVGDARSATQEWVTEHAEAWAGLRAAHLVGGITTMALDAPFPSFKDADLHLIFDEGSAMLESKDPFVNIVEDEYRGVLIEAGIKPAAEYASADAVLANPEVAHHLTTDCVLHDPDGLLRALQEPVRRDYARRRWVDERLAYEQRGLDGAMGMVAMARASWGAAGVANLLGYTFTFVTAAFDVATLQPPRVGSHMPVHLRAHFARHGRPDLHEEVLGVLGARGATAPEVEARFAEAVELFDIAVRVKKGPFPFGHKLQAHLRPYFVDAARAMIDDGDHREALLWVMAYYVSCAGVILQYGGEDEKPMAESRLDGFLRYIGLDSPDSIDAATERAKEVHTAAFALAREVAARNPDIRD